MDFISLLEKEIGKKAIKDFLPMQPGDVEETFADTENISEYIGFKPSTNIKKGIKEFISWYKNYYLNRLRSNVKFFLFYTRIFNKLMF